jgi:hypothetical protein
MSYPWDAGVTDTLDERGQVETLIRWVELNGIFGHPTPAVYAFLGRVRATLRAGRLPSPRVLSRLKDMASRYGGEAGW